MPRSYRLKIRRRFLPYRAIWGFAPQGKVILSSFDFSISEHLLIIKIDFKVNGLLLC